MNTTYTTYELTYAAETRKHFLKCLRAKIDEKMPRYHQTTYDPIPEEAVISIPRKDSYTGHPRMEIDHHPGEFSIKGWGVVKEISPCRTANKGTAFETDFQRVRAQPFQVTGTPVSGILFAHDLKGSWDVSRYWRVEVGLGEPVEGIWSEGCFRPVSGPVLASNSCLPTVGEQIVL